MTDPHGYQPNDPSAAAVEHTGTGWESPILTVRRDLFTVFGANFRVLGAGDELLLFARQKAFRLREDLRFYEDEGRTQERLRISARSMMDFGTTYDVFDTQYGRLGAWRRRGIRSIARDTWQLLDLNDQPVGELREDSVGMALLRRFLGSFFFPQRFHLDLGGRRVCQFKQRFNPFVYKLDADFSFDIDGHLDARLGIAVAVLIAAIEGRQE